MKKLLCILLTLTMVLALGAPAFADDAAKAPVFADGAAQPILQYTNLRDANYTNEGSNILRFCVYVETDHDTDGDGKADLVEALVQVPRAAPNQQNPNQIFPMGDGFGFCVFYRKQYFPNGMPCRPESKPRDPKKKKQNEFGGFDDENTDFLQVSRRFPDCRAAAHRRHADRHRVHGRRR